MTIFSKKLSLQGLGATLLKRKKTIRHFVEIEIAEVGAKQSLVVIEGESILLPNDKIIQVEE